MIFSIVFILGILIGSFLNVCIFRIPLKQEIVYTPSHCMTCGYKLKWYDNIPIISYLQIGGKCRQCRSKLSIQYPLIELSNGAAYLGLYWRYGLTWQLGMMCILFSTLLVISMIDINHQIIPNSILTFLMIVSTVYVVFLSKTYISSIVGFFAVSGLLLLISIISKGKMGGGDIKLMAVCGFLLGWQNILVSLVLGSILGSAVGITLIVFKFIKKNQLIPFGPYLSVGIMLAAVYGNDLVDWYLGFLI